MFFFFAIFWVRREVLTILQTSAVTLMVSVFAIFGGRALNPSMRAVPTIFDFARAKLVLLIFLRPKKLRFTSISAFAYAEPKENVDSKFRTEHY